MSGTGMIYFAYGLVILCQISAILSGNVVPVLITGDENSGSMGPVNPLVKISPNEFAEKIANIVGGSLPPIVVYKKQNLCVEELSQQKSDLSILGKWDYLPAVESPFHTLDNLPFYNISTGENPEVISDGQMIVHPIQDLNNVVESYKNLLASNPSVIAILTGSSCSYSRSERTRRAITPVNDTETPVNDTEIIIRANRILLYTGKGIYLKPEGADNYISLGTPTTASTVSNETDLSLVLVYSTTNTTTSELTLELKFSVRSAGYWYFDNIEYETNSVSQILPSNQTIYFPFTFSYHCSLKSVFSNGNTTLNITDLQVQIYPKTTTTTNASFSDVYDCIGFTSIPIWSGIFVTFILGLIMIWALTMILDIRTMDRFDDPKGKTITITGTD